jgi:hypothetical protein
MRILVARDAAGPFALYGFPDFPQLLESSNVFEIFVAEGDSLELAQSRARIKCARYDIDPLTVKGLIEKSPRQ